MRFLRTPATRAGRYLLALALAGIAFASIALIVPVHVTLGDGTAYGCGPPALAWPTGSGNWQRDEAERFLAQGATPSPLTPVTACKPEVGERFLFAGALVVLTVTPAVLWFLWVVLNLADDAWELRNRSRD